jgi:hypothetical protein
MNARFTVNVDLIDFGIYSRFEKITHRLADVAQGLIRYVHAEGRTVAANAKIQLSAAVLVQNGRHRDDALVQLSGRPLEFKYLIFFSELHIFPSLSLDRREQTISASRCTLMFPPPAEYQKPQFDSIVILHPFCDAVNRFLFPKNRVILYAYP